MKKLALLITTLFTIILVGCENYTYTFNEQPVFTPPGLFTEYQVSDQGLAGCLNQAILDQKASKARDLTQLNCSNAGITSLSGLEIFTGLTQVNLGNNLLSDIKPLLFLPHLDTVLLGGNEKLDCRDGKQLLNQASGTVSLPTHCSK
ncbi:leucine-rich repeat domain-containing protein [Porticoccus sp.]